MLKLKKTNFPGPVAQVRGSALSVILPWLVLLALWSTGVASLKLLGGFQWFDLTTLPFTLIGLALSIFLGFRNNACYDRWWEARKHWGRLINTTRSITRQILTLLPASEEEKRTLVMAIVGYCYALKQHLRNERELDRLVPYLGEDWVAKLEPEMNVPIAILQELGDRMTAYFHQGDMDSILVTSFSDMLTTLTDIQGACERIKNTPVPGSYTVLTHRIVALYCFALPFGIVNTVGWMTPLVAVIIGYAFLGLDEVGTQIEDPFEYDPNDLPLMAICTMIEQNLRQRLGDTELPESVPAKHGILL